LQRAHIKASNQLAASVTAENRGNGYWVNLGKSCLRNLPYLADEGAFFVVGTLPAWSVFLFKVAQAFPLPQTTTPYQQSSRKACGMLIL